MLTVAQCIYTMLIACQSSAQPVQAKSAGRPVTLIEIENSISACPSLGQVAFSTLGGSGFNSLSNRIEQSMEALQPISTADLRRALAAFEHRGDPGTPEGRRRRAEFAAKHPGATDAELDESASFFIENESIGPAFWMCRFLFKVPEKQLRDKFAGVFAYPPSGDGTSDLLFPVRVISGKPTIDHVPIQYPEGGWPEALYEFDYYAKHFKRRSKWW